MLNGQSIYNCKAFIPRECALGTVEKRGSVCEDEAAGSVAGDDSYSECLACCTPGHGVVAVED